MSDSDELNLDYSFDNLFEIAENSTYTDSVSESPICDSLRTITNNYTDFIEIGRGGMKCIYKVHDAKLNRHVALAKLLPNIPRSLYDSFIREARLTALLEHPNIISVHDSGLNDDSTPFFTMELKVGEHLGQVIRKAASDEYCGKVSLNSLLNDYVKICDAVSYAHSKNVLHLDLKPENIQLGKFGEVIVCDWGLGKVIGSDDNIEFDKVLFNPDMLNNITLGGELKGTPGYMAPEQITGEGEKTKQTDIYALGSLLYTLLTSKPPFRGEVNTVLERTVKGVIVEPIERCFKWSVPEGLNAVVMKAMALRPKDRYESVEDLANDVQSYLDGRTTSAEQAGVLKEVNLFYKRNRIVCNIAVAFLLVVTAVATGFMMKLQRSNVRLTTERDRADEKTRQALYEHERAEEALARAGIEKNLSELFIHGQRWKLGQIYKYTDELVYGDAVTSLEQAEELLTQLIHDTSSSGWLRMQRGYVLFLQQKFAAANADFAISSATAEVLAELSLKYAGKLRSDGMLPIDDMSALFERLLSEKYQLAAVVKMLKYDGVKRKSLSDRAKLVQLVLEFTNPKWTAPQFIYDEETFSLKISGEGFTLIGVTGKHLPDRGPKPTGLISFISTLKIKKLDLSNTSFYGLHKLVGLGIEELNICDTPVGDLNSLSEMRCLKRLIIPANYYGKEKIATIPSNIEIIYIK